MTPQAPLFIVGCPRSGTTLLQRLLDAHPDVAVAPETHFMRRFWLNRRAFGSLDADANFRRLLDAITAAPEFADLRLDAGAWTQAAWQGERSYAALLWLLLDSFARAHSARIVGEKTPNHVFFLSDLHSLFPEARFVHIVRDPRAVADSWRRLSWSSGAAWRDAVRWRRHVRAALAWQGPALCTVHYEQLVQEPEPCLRHLCQFLGLTFEPDMLEYHRQPTTAFDPEREPWKRTALQPIAGELATRWRQDLSADEIAAVEAVAWPEMRRYGYQPLTPPLRLAPLFLFYRGRMAVDHVRRAANRRWKQASSGRPPVAEPPA